MRMQHDACVYIDTVTIDAAASATTEWMDGGGLVRRSPPGCRPHPHRPSVSRRARGVAVHARTDTYCTLGSSPCPLPLPRRAPLALACLISPVRQGCHRRTSWWYARGVVDVGLRSRARRVGLRKEWMDPAGQIHIHPRLS